ncbi:hypothetical protein, partial [Methylobacterium sp. WL6]|uniref:hypothetical protein n=1 Tax=Methylobacterium sp. WL6 TaxID=2603901 RepID=UPI0011CC34BA
MRNGVAGVYSELGNAGGLALGIVGVMAVEAGVRRQEREIQRVRNVDAVGELAARLREARTAQARAEAEAAALRAELA